MKRMLKPLTLALVAAGLTACVQTPDGSLPKQALDEALQTRPDAVPAAVEQELLSSRRPAAGTSLAPARRFDIAARDVDAREFFAALGSQHNVSIAVHPDVTGTITLNLRRVTLPEILDAISGLYGYGIEQRSGVYQVYANGVRSRTFNVNYLMLSRNGQSQTAISGSSLGSSDEDSNTGGSSTRINTESNNDFWSDLESALGRLIGNEEGRVVVTNPQAGLVTVRAAPDELALVDDFLTRAERQLKRQVILEARIVEVELNDGYEQGIEWNNLSANSRSGQVATGNTAVTYPGFLSPLSDLLGGGAVFTYTDGNFDAVVNLLQTQGEVNTLSNPRVTTSNNQKAVIKVGTDEYFVTEFSLTTTTGSSGVSERTPEVELQPFFSGISLDVTPQIADDNRVLLHIHPAVSEVEDSNKIIDFGDGALILPLAKSTVRESDTIVEAASGEVIIIGGLMQEKQTEQETAIPLISEIPVLGNLFKNRNLATQKSELVIMLRPVVVAANTWQTELQRSRDLLEKWYPPQPEPIPVNHEYRGAR
ncbi:pilus (MSHA type) biogenesis protein MshL [Oceanimonas sp. CAM02]|uniref:pilus (MSHA type) biogenesis protein MshL n=1 Tax=Oceanimonas sp. CAM02 TaxID=3080336 RepID=UPI0029368229|nr:pilus (MSHA type) biogenesis protein MshL [Oceanimonas sp. CAM02]MDV2858624.1 pilus (MSHA type) biogenesis protein MshL [Oceanimonas sp. CAM02]